MAQEDSRFRAGYEDSTLGQGGPLTIMPFNRLIRSAGKVITFGDPKQDSGLGRAQPVQDRRFDRSSEFWRERRQRWPEAPVLYPHEDLVLS